VGRQKIVSSRRRNDETTFNGLKIATGNGHFHFKFFSHWCCGHHLAPSSCCPEFFHARVLDTSRLFSVL